MTFSEQCTQWRLWAAVFGPSVVAYGAAYALGDTLLGTLLALTFCLTVGASFARYMARTQARKELRDELHRLQTEFVDVADMVNQMPYEQAEPYLEGLHRMEFRIRVLEEILEAQK